jgi:hypothetical protein
VKDARARPHRDREVHLQYLDLLCAQCRLTALCDAHPGVCPVANARFALPDGGELDDGALEDMLDLAGAMLEGGE